MKLISNKTTNFHKKIMPIIFLIGLLTSVFCPMVLNIESEGLQAVPFFILFVSFIWLISYRRLKEVYLGDRYLIVDGKKISFNEIVSVNKNVFVKYYRIRYRHLDVSKQLDVVRSFIFLPGAVPASVLPFAIPYYIKEIKKAINQK